jgi:hypothetical protein
MTRVFPGEAERTKIGMQHGRLRGQLFVSPDYFQSEKEAKSAEHFVFQHAGSALTIS